MPVSLHSTPMKSRMCSPYPLGVVKGDLMGWFLGITVLKGWPLVGAWTGTLKNTTKYLWRWEPDRMFNFLIQSACTSMCRHIYNWNIVACDVKQQISLAHSWHLRQLCLDAVAHHSDLCRKSKFQVQLLQLYRNNLELTCPVCPKSPSVRGFVLCLPFRLSSCVYLFAYCLNPHNTMYITQFRQLVYMSQCGNDKTG